MKKKFSQIVLLFCLSTLLTSGLIGCSQSQPSSTGWWKDYIDLKTATETYSVKDAKAAGYVIIVDNHVASGEDIWNDFVFHTKLGESARIRIVHDYLLSTYDSYAVPNTHSYITEVEYDGKKYISRSYSEGELFQSEYKYMLRFEGDPESPYADYDHYVSYVLVNDDTVTYDDLWKSVLSSAAGAYIPHDEIYTDLTPHKP